MDSTDDGQWKKHGTAAIIKSRTGETQNGNAALIRQSQFEFLN
jgi:hypothetical protein